MSYNKLLYHIVFRPKNGAMVINEQHEEDFYHFVWAFTRKRGCVLYRIGGMPDHVHMFVQLPATLSVSSFMHDLKLATNKFMTENRDKFPMFDSWGRSYCALTYSEAAKDNVVNYITTQKEHHKTVGFKEELEALLRENGIDFDMKYFML